MKPTAEDLAREQSQKRARGEKENNIFLWILWNKWTKQIKLMENTVKLAYLLDLFFVDLQYCGNGKQSGWYVNIVESTEEYVCIQNVPVNKYTSYKYAQ